MSSRKLFPGKTNSNRAKAGSVKGKEGREYPLQLAKRLNSDPAFVQQVCNAIGRSSALFSHAEAGKVFTKKVASIALGCDKVYPKTSLRMVWKDGSSVNFHVTISRDSQIQLRITDSFIAEFESRCGVRIPSKVKNALRLFTGRHPHQSEILAKIPVDCVTKRVRKNVEQAYWDRLTLASMYGYDASMPPKLLRWFCSNCDKIFEYCFVYGGASDEKLSANYIWYRSNKAGKDGFEIFNLQLIKSKLRSMIKNKGLKGTLVVADDDEGVGSTLSFPFGQLQYHERKLQFRHNIEKMRKLVEYKKTKRNKFGSRPKKDGHRNEKRIAEELNKNLEFRKHFCEKLGVPTSHFLRAEAGGASAKKLESIVGESPVEGKKDVVVLWKGGTVLNVSIKMSTEGQAYLLHASRFIAVFEAQYGKIIPEDVKRALLLFVGETLESRRILAGTPISVDGVKLRKQAQRHNHRLLFDVLRNYDHCLAENLLLWLKHEIEDIFELCFSAGAVKDRTLWAHVLWYKNLVNAKGSGLDYMVTIKDIMTALEKNSKNNVVERGPRNAGSTIILPFGSVQYHKAQLQFRHSMAKIRALEEVLRA